MVERRSGGFYVASCKGRRSVWSIKAEWCCKLSASLVHDQRGPHLYNAAAMESTSITWTTLDEALALALALVQ